MRALAIAVSVFCSLLIAPGSVLAQGKPSAEIAGGYSFMHDYQVKENFPAAWFASAGCNITGWLAAVGEVGGSYKSYDFTVDSAKFSTTTRLHTLLAGPRWRLKGGAAFAQVLGGAAWESGGVTVFRQSIASRDRKLAVQPGGGVDVPLTNRLSARVGVDYRRIFAKRKNTDQKNNNEFRFAAGLVVEFGNR